MPVEWRECGCAGTPEGGYDEYRKCQSNDVPFYHRIVWSHQCATCPIPAQEAKAKLVELMVEAVRDSIPILDACATIIECETKRHSDDQDECQACETRRHTKRLLAALAAYEKAEKEAT